MGSPGCFGLDKDFLTQTKRGHNYMYLESQSTSEMGTSTCSYRAMSHFSRVVWRVQVYVSPNNPNPRIAPPCDTFEAPFHFRREHQARRRQKSATGAFCMSKGPWMAMRRRKSAKAMRRQPAHSWPAANALDACKSAST